MMAVVLGPHPGNGSFSIMNYFRFYQRELATVLPDWSIASDRPGPSDESLSPQRIRRRWENFVEWPLRLTKVTTDLAHVVDQGLAWYGTFLPKCQRIITVHDLISYMTWKGSLDFGATTSRKKMLIAECVRQIKRYDHIICVSQCTADHVISLLGIPASRISLVPNVLEDSFLPLSTAERFSARSLWFGDAEHVIVHVGKPSTYKNRIGALRAFSILSKQLPAARMFLVHGLPDPHESAFLKECGCAGKIKFLPPITRQELRQYYGAADILIFPSLYEGFGWPPLEAMACGCPVMSTTCGSLGEVVGDAALTLSDPHDHQRMADLLHSALTEPATGSDLRRRGLERAKLFAPSVALNRVAEIYRSMV
jgi:glycosyltransferase involved in cell wall biosynthesis